MLECKILHKVVISIVAYVIICSSVVLYRRYVIVVVL